ncbi:MAG: hypothetical protein EAZ85_13535 [Bacteroidetes bacterium]|nr:MAG: hypothetical protein EAZ85_13535 [Bacteroidota bacterium]
MIKKQMKFEKIKSIITEIAQREMVNDIDEDVFIYHFPNPKTINFLAKLVYFSMPFHLTLLCRYGRVDNSYEKGLILHKKGKKWYLGNYRNNRKKHFSNFVHFFSEVLRFFPLYFSFGKHIAFTEYTQKKEVFAHVLRNIKNNNQSYEYNYPLKFVDILSKFANTGIKLQIIINDSEGNFHVTTSRVWVRFCFPSEHIFFENTKLNYRKPDFIKSGFYIGMENKIVQIKYKNKILYSENAFSEAEMDYRRNYIWDLIEKYQKCSD